MATELRLQKETTPNFSQPGLYDESVLYKTDIWSYLADGELNPEDISFTTFTKMRREDAQVNAAVRIIVLAALARGWELNYDGKNVKLGTEMIAYLNQIFGEVNSTQWRQGGITQWMEEIIEISISYGFSASEMVYNVIDFNGDPKIGLKKLKVVPALSVENGLVWDKFGDLIKIIQRVQNAPRQVGGERNELDLDRMLIWSYRMEGCNWYGQSDLRQIYKNWYIKDFVLKMWNIALERYGTPILLGKVRNKKDLGDMADILDSVRTKSNLSIVSGDEVEPIEMKSTTDAFEKAIRYHDSKIMIGLLVPTLLLSQENVGARALGDTHLEVFLLRLKAIQNELNETMKQLIKIMIDFNFTDVDVYPEMTFREMSSADKLQMAKTLDILISAEIVAPDEPWIRKHVGLPEAKDIVSGIVKVKKDPTIPNEPDDTEPTEDLTEMQLVDLKWNENHEQVNNTIKRFERKMARSLKTYINLIDDDVMDRSKSIIGNSEQLSLPSPSKTGINAFTKTMQDAFNEGFNSGKKLMDDLQGTESEFTLQEVPEWIAERSAFVFSKMQGRVETRILDTIVEGMTVAEFQESVDHLIDIELRSSRGIQAIVATNAFASFNAGRAELFKENPDFIKGARYSAVLDTGTTPFCREHNGMVIAISDPRFQSIIPPNHMLCRSILEGVTILDTSVKFTWRNGNTNQDPGFGIEATTVGDI